MNGGSIPYHLRTNKAIDRQIFFEILSQLSLPCKIQKYRYISLGGPMLEDHHNLHHYLGMTKLESIERDKATLSRQIFNQSYACITCTEKSISGFLNEFERNENTILWLDYTDTCWAEQFLDIHSAFEKLEEYDICKITINANPDSLIDTQCMGTSKVDIFKQKASGKFINENITNNDVSLMDRFAMTLSNTIETISQSALDLLEDLNFNPITIFRYIDNKHQMLSITGIILKKTASSNLSALLNESHLDVKPHICKSWSDIHEINVPDLTARERFEINKMLPTDQETINTDLLPFKLHANKTKAQRAITNYIKYYRYIPNFQRMAR